MWLILGQSWCQVGLAFLLDLVAGDPRWLPHPVVIIGRAISALERAARALVGNRPVAERLAGLVLVVVIVGGTYLATSGIIAAAGGPSSPAGALLSVLLLYTTLATKSLGDHLLAIVRPLNAHDLGAARRALSLVVGRDTAHLDEVEIARAAVETAAENASDGIVAPLIYAFLGGAPLAMAYKAVNTLDSMIGHRDQRYLHLGWAAARLDDLANYLPARVTGSLIVVAATLSGRSWRHAWATMQRDGRKHPSPNSGYPEAAMAGALGVRLGGSNTYGGQFSLRPHLGEGGRLATTADIRSAISLVRLVSWLAVLLGLGVSMALGVYIL